MLVTERLRLKEWREADKALLAEIHSDPEVMQFLGGVKSFEETCEVVALLVSMFRSGEPGFWAAERISDGALIGWLGLHNLGPEYPFGPAREIGWRLGRSGEAARKVFARGAGASRGIRHSPSQPRHRRRRRKPDVKRADD